MVYGYVEEKLSPTSFVYIVRDGTGFVKIGKANDVLSRINELQVGNPNEIQLIVALKVKQEDVNTLEKELHSIFKKQRIRGEWFKERPVLDYLNKSKVYIGDYLFEDLDEIIKGEIKNA